MSHTIMVEGTDISITKFAAPWKNNKPSGSNYQVTWRSSDKEKLFDYVVFDSWRKAKEFSQVLQERLVR